MIMRTSMTKAMMKKYNVDKSNDDNDDAGNDDDVDKWTILVVTRTLMMMTMKMMMPMNKIIKQWQPLNIKDYDSGDDDSDEKNDTT